MERVVKVYLSSAIGDTRQYHRATFGFFYNTHEKQFGTASYPDGGPALYAFYSTHILNRNKVGRVDREG